MASEGKFKVGDRVRATDDDPQAEIGTIVSYYADIGYLVKFDHWRDGHEGEGDLPDGSGWWLNEDQIEPLNDGPVRTVMRREIVPGEYGPVTLYGDASATASYATASHAREAARIFNEIADALEELE